MTAQPNNLLLYCAVLLVLLMIGLRYEVGGDWGSYLRIFNQIESRSLERAIATSQQEIGYTLVNWLAARAGIDIWGANLLCAIPFVIGLTAICKQQPNPWLALAVAVPLFIVVVGMGFTRQAAAAGFLMIGMSGLIRGGSFWRFSCWILLGSLFHQSVLILIPIAALFVFRARLGSILLVAAAILIGYFVLLPLVFERYSAGYIRTVYEAEGAVFRISLNAFAGLFVIILSDRFQWSPREARVWRGWAFLSIASLVAYFLVSSSVILDRLAMYIMPLQVFVFSQLPAALGRRESPSPGWTAVVLCQTALLLFVWLNYANHAKYWVPYKLYPLS